MLPYIYIFGRTIPMYGVCILLGLFVAGFNMVLECKKKNLVWENALIAVAVGLGFGFFGAKILYIAVTFTFKEFVYIIQQGKLDAIINGGFVFYGGLVCGVLGAFLGVRIAKCNMRDYENVLIKTVPLAHGFGRIGCLCSGCCYGKPTSSALHIVFTNPASNAPLGVALIPVQIYESAFNFVLFFLLVAIDKKYPGNRILLPVYIIAYSVERFIIEYFRYDAARGFLMGFSTSQWISAALFVIGAVMLLVRLNRKTIDVQ